MAQLGLPPTLDVPSIAKESVGETVDAWLHHLEEGAHGVRVAPALAFSLKVYGQPVSLETVLAGIHSRFDGLDRVTKDITRTLWKCSRGRVLDLRSCDPVYLPFLRDGLRFNFPVPGLIIDKGNTRFLTIQARKKPPFSRSGYRFFGAMLRNAIDRTPQFGADSEIVDISAPDGGRRRPAVFNLSSIRIMSDEELDGRLTILAEAYDVLKTMELPETAKRARYRDPDQGEFEI